MFSTIDECVVFDKIVSVSIGIFVLLMVLFYSVASFNKLSGFVAVQTGTGVNIENVSSIENTAVSIDYATWQKDSCWKGF